MREDSQEAGISVSVVVFIRSVRRGGRVLINMDSDLPKAGKDNYNSESSRFWNHAPASQVCNVFQVHNVLQIHKDTRLAILEDICNMVAHPFTQ